MEFFDHIRGLWRLERALTDRRAGVSARFAGRLLCEADADGLRLREEGSWCDAPRGSLSGARVDLWRPKGAQIAVLFEDGRPFHQFTPVWEADILVDHLCGRDDYRGCYRFAHGQWDLRWQVRGPAKDYDTRTKFTRLDAPA